jgi:PIN domain nuclease of toxin-antitoxin system
MYLADACALLAYFSGMGVLTTAGRSAMRGEVFVSAITVWELTQRAGSGKLPPLPAEDGTFVGWLEAEKFRFQPLTWPDAERANRLPPIHKDPMDRMLIAQALNARLTIITNDGNFAAYGVATIW